MGGRVCRLHSVRLLGPPSSGDSHASLMEYRTVSFALGLIAAQAQIRVLDLLKRRAVLLRLLGARTTINAGLTLLLMGAFAVVQQARSITFLREVSPSPWWCCTVLWIRKQGVLVGVLLPPVLHLLLQQRLFGGLPVDALVPLTLVVGAVIGGLFTSSFSSLWQEKRDALESDYGVLYLFPHMSSQALNKASAAMRLALRKGAEVSVDLGAEWVITRAVRGGFNFAATLFMGRVAGT